MNHTRHVMPELNSGAMADVAFLMFIFYMVAVEIKEYQGLTLMLPPNEPDPIQVQKNNRNIFSIYINSTDQIMVEGEVVPSLKGVRNDIKKFVLNYKKDPTLSDNPMEAMISIKTDRGASYKAFMGALDEAQAAYYEIYADRVGVSPERFRKLNIRIHLDREAYEKARQGIPMNIAIAEFR